MSIVAGVDVGGARKGFHAVALRDGVYLDKFAARDAVAVADWCRTVGARVIGVDAPCRWSLTGRARPAERALMAEGI
jgi:predicted nuclease with RNAse H fold